MPVSTSWAAGGSSANGSGKCAGKCKVTESTFPSQPVSQSKDAVGQFFLDSTIMVSPKGQKGQKGGGAGIGRVAVHQPAVGRPQQRHQPADASGPVRQHSSGHVEARLCMPCIPEMACAQNGEFPELAKHIEYAQNTRFRCTGWAVQVRAEVPKSPSDPRRGEAGRLGRFLPGTPEIGGGLGSEPELGMGRDHEPRPAVRGLGRAKLRAGPAEGLFDHVEGMFRVEAAEERLPVQVDVAAGHAGP